MKFKNLIESIESRNTMTIRIASGLNADGCDIIITNTEGNILHKEEYRYGYNASHNRTWAKWYPEKPYMKDIIDELCSKYNIVKSEIVFKCGANVFTGNDVSDATVTEFRNKFVESLTENIDKTVIRYMVDMIPKDDSEKEHSFIYASNEEEMKAKVAAKYDLNDWIIGGWEVQHVPSFYQTIDEDIDKQQYIICGIAIDGTKMFWNATKHDFVYEVSDATIYDDQDTARDDWFKIPRGGFRRIFIPIYDPAVFESLNEGKRADSVREFAKALQVFAEDDPQKLVTTTTKVIDSISDEDLDNVFDALSDKIKNIELPSITIDQVKQLVGNSYDTSNCSSLRDFLDILDGTTFIKEHPKAAKSLLIIVLTAISLIEPSPVVEVITLVVGFLPAEAIGKILEMVMMLNPFTRRVKFVKSILDRKNEDLVPSNVDEFETDCRYYVYDENDNVISDEFEFEDDAIDYAKENLCPVVKIHNYFIDENGKLRPNGSPTVVWSI